MALYTTMSWTEFRPVVESGLRSALGHYGWLVAKDAEGKVVNWGTATFVRVDDAPFLLTADHVVDGLLRAQGDTWLLTFPEQQLRVANHGDRAIPEAYPIDLQRSEGTIRMGWLDAAAIEPTPEILTAPGIKWFEGARQGQAITAVREVDALPNDGAIVQLAIVGFPTFAHLEFTNERVQLASNRPLLVVLRSIDARNVDWTHQRRPQMNLEVDADELISMPDGAGAIERALVERLRRRDGVDGSALGGYSGAPVLLPSTEGTFVVGLAVQARLDAGCVVATPIDEVLSALIRDRSSASR